MSEYSQKSTRITNFYQLSENTDILDDLVRHSRWKKPVLVIPALASEFSDSENRPVFENILRELKGATYLNDIIIGLDAATQEDVHLLKKIIAEIGLENTLIQWNDGPHFKSLYELLESAGIDLSERGKGRNVFMSFGVAIVLSATSVGLLDADVKTFRRTQLDRLFFPVEVFNYQFAKAYYARSDGRRFFGRVKRLLVDPLLIALKRKFTDTGEEKMLRIIDFLLLFNYQLSGEFVIDTELLQRMKYTLNWGVEILTLIEAYRKANQIAQVEFAKGYFDHKHQKISVSDADKGLHRMSTDIIATLLNALVIEEGLEISNHFFRDLALTYQSVAEELIKKYAENARLNELSYDRDLEEKFVNEVITDAIINVGEFLDVPQNISGMFLRYTAMNPEFEKFSRLGLQKAIMDTEKRIKQEHRFSRDLPSWERIEEKIPEIRDNIIDVIEEVKRDKKGGA
jgi:glucosyl-3-phosphoglycerate synthase